MSTRSTRFRLVLTFLFTLGLVALAAAPAGAAEAGEDRRDPARFSTDAVALRKAGWTLAAAETASDGGSGVVVRVTLVDAARAHAVQLSLGFGEREQVTSYVRARVPVPEARRVYANEDALFEALAGGAVESLYEECGSTVLHLADGRDVSVPEYEWHVVRRAATGEAAGTVLADEVRTRLRAGAHVAAVERREGGVVFVITASEAATIVVDASLDARGRVAAVEVREQPSAYASGTLKSERKLAQALTRGGAVRGVAFTNVDGAVRVRLELARGKAFVVDTAAIEYPEYEGCGC